jgi:hypothetical protein
MARLEYDRDKNRELNKLKLDKMPADEMLTKEQRLEKYILKLKVAGNLECISCGLPAGLKGITLEKVTIGGEKYDACTRCAKELNKR